jgi:hypothetical protein
MSSIPKRCGGALYKSLMNAYRATLSKKPNNDILIARCQLVNGNGDVMFYVTSNKTPRNIVLPVPRNPTKVF